jgi:hypothetical protein
MISTSSGIVILTASLLIDFLMGSVVELMGSVVELMGSVVEPMGMIWRE